MQNWTFSIYTEDYTSDQCRPMMIIGVIQNTKSIQISVRSFAHWNGFSLWQLATHNSCDYPWVYTRWWHLHNHHHRRAELENCRNGAEWYAKSFSVAIDWVIHQNHILSVNSILFCRQCSKHITETAKRSQVIAMSPFHGSFGRQVLCVERREIGEYAKDTLLHIPIVYVCAVEWKGCVARRVCHYKSVTVAGEACVGHVYEIGNYFISRKSN